MTVAGRLAWTFHAWCYAVLRASIRPFAGPRSGCFQGRSKTSWCVTCWPGPPGAEPRRVGVPRGGSRSGCVGSPTRCADLLARCQERGIDPADLDELGSVTGRRAWESFAPFYADYLDNLDWQAAVDYSGLVRQDRPTARHS